MLPQKIKKSYTWRKARIVTLLILPAVILSFIITNYCPNAWRKDDFYMIGDDLLYQHMKEFVWKENILQSASNDPWLLVSPDVEETYRGIEIDVSYLSVETTQCQIFFETKSQPRFSEQQSVRHDISCGTNRLTFSTEATGTLRLDLTSNEGVEMVLQEVRLIVPGKEMSKEGIIHLIDIIAVYFTIVLICYFRWKNRDTVKGGEVSSEKRKAFIPAFDFVRAVSAMGIVCFHFLCHTHCQALTVYLTYASGAWGSAFVTVFFILSGASILYQNESIKTMPVLKSFYLKRWKSIFPMFYIAYLLVFIRTSIAQGTVFYSQYFVLSLLGLDGHFLYLAPNYYILGEWFLGAIILIYLMYPLLLLGIRKTGLGVWGVVFILYVLSLNTPLLYKLNISPFRNLISCLLSFTTGMVFIKNLERIKTCLRHKCFQICVFILLFACFTYLLVFRPSVAWLCDAHIFGTVLFLILFIGGSYIMESTCIKNIVKRISDLSYPIFLLHHVIIYDFFNLRNPAKIGPTLAIFIAVLITVLISARCIALFTKYLLTHNSLKKKKGGVAL